jgi:hypothetical protein
MLLIIIWKNVREKKDKEKKKWSQSFEGLAVLLIFEG